MTAVSVLETQMRGLMPPPYPRKTCSALDHHRFKTASVAKRREIREMSFYSIDVRNDFISSCLEHVCSKEVLKDKRLKKQHYPVSFSVHLLHLHCIEVVSSEGHTIEGYLPHLNG